MIPKAISRCNALFPRDLCIVVFLTSARLRFFARFSRKENAMLGLLFLKDLLVALALK